MDSLIPLLYNKCGDDQKAVEAAVHLVEQEVQTFDWAAVALLKNYSGQTLMIES